eukprot:SAG11_NODE_1158_length_5655_cov_6.340173_2_plen_106_part_00
MGGALVFRGVVPVIFRAPTSPSFGINLLDLFPYGSFREGLYANNPPKRGFVAVRSDRINSRTTVKNGIISLVFYDPVRVVLPSLEPTEPTLCTSKSGRIDRAMLL